MSLCHYYTHGLLSLVKFWTQEIIKKYPVLHVQLVLLLLALTGLCFYARIQKMNAQTQTGNYQKGKGLFIASNLLIGVQFI
jgi:hypothetical protein